MEHAWKMGSWIGKEDKKEKVSAIEEATRLGPDTSGLIQDYARIYKVDSRFIWYRGRSGLEYLDRRGTAALS